MPIFSTGIPADTYIGKFNLHLMNRLEIQMGPNDLLIDQTWLHSNREFKNLLQRKFSNIYLYSGIDKEDLNWWSNIYNDLFFRDIKIIGNHYGPNFFSFWLEFAHKHLNSYSNFDCFKVSGNIKSYMCLNRKRHHHRQHLIYLLNKSNLISQGIVSLGKLKNSEKDYYPLPPSLDLEIDIESDQIGESFYDSRKNTNNISNLGHPINWNNHFLNVVTETSVDSFGFISEKTLKPIIGKRPFVILGDPYIYKILHDWGIDTFDDILGSGYNYPYKEKIKWIVETIENINKEKNLKELLLSLKPRLENNYLNLLNAMKLNSSRIDNIIKLI